VVLRIEAFSPGCVQVLPREGEAPWILCLSPSPGFALQL
jgi:hypothetical protein